MGVRINAYAVDLPRLAKLLDSSLAELLCRYKQDGTDPQERLMFIGEQDIMFTTVPGGPIHGAVTTSNGREGGTYTEVQLREVPFLQQSARELLSSFGNFNTQWLLQAFSKCAGTRFIHCMVDGHRRWWIGGLLESAEQILDRRSYDELVHLMHKVLRQCNCGHPIPEGDIGADTEGLPFTPDLAPEPSIGRWRPAELRNAAALVSAILAASPIFHSPHGPVGISPDDDEWHAWVLENAQAIAELRHIEWPECNLISFID